MRTQNVLHSRCGRLSAFGILYIPESIPYGFSSTAMVAFMRIEGLSLEQIGAFVAATVVFALCAIPFLKNREEKKQPGVAADRVALANVQQ